MNDAMRKVLTRKDVLFSAVGLVLYTLVGFLGIPELLRWYIPKYVQQNLHCLATVDKVRLNPFLLTFEIDRFSLKQADDLPLVAFERFFVDLELSSLIHRAAVVKTLELDKPDIRVGIEPDGSLNLAKLIPPRSQTPQPVQAETKPAPFIVENAAIRGGRVALVDKRQSTPADFAVQEINLQLKDLATVKEHNGAYLLTAVGDEGAALKWEGQVSLTPVGAKGTLALNSFRIASLWKFLKDRLNLEQPAGTLNFATEYQLDQKNIKLEKVHVALEDMVCKLSDADSPLLQLKKVEMEAPQFDLANRELHLASLRLEEGAITTKIAATGTMNWQQIVRKAAAVTPKANDPAAPSAASESGASPQAEEKKTDPAPAPVPAKEPIFKVQADAIDLSNIAFALDDESRVTPLKAGIGGMDLHLQALAELGGETPHVVVKDAASELRGIRIDGGQGREPLFVTEKLLVEGGAFDLGAQQVGVSRIAVQQGALNVMRDREGMLDWQRLLQKKGAPEENKGSRPAPTKASPSPWKYAVQSFEIEGFSSKFADLTTNSEKPVLSVRKIATRLTDVNGASPIKFAVGFEVEQGGKATLNGTVDPAIPSVDAVVDISGIVLTSLQPYLEPYVTLTLQSAAASAKGHFRYGVPGSGSQQGIYEGSFGVNNLRLAEAGAKKPYLSWDSVLLPKFTLTLQPNRLDAQEVRIVKPVGEFIIGEDKTLNLVKVLKKPSGGKQSAATVKKTGDKPVAKKSASKTRSKTKVAKADKKAGGVPVAKKGAPQAKAEPFSYRISRVLVEKGDLVFADLSLRPRFTTHIHDLKGSVSGLASRPDAQAKIQMAGAVDRYGSAKITGELYPSDFAKSSNVSLIFRNVEMKNLSPYSGRFAGRLIKSGKVSADLQYKVQDYKMNGENKIIIDNLLLGEHVNTPGAVNLPLDLAIALLKDANGRIDIGLPVTGELNDPHFSIGSLVWKVITNLITKATTAPFRAIGHLFGGDTDKLDALEFEAGSAELPPPEKEKLGKVVDALKGRPQLKLVVQGRYSPEVDGLELRERSIRRLVNAKLGIKTSPDDAPEPLDFGDSATQNALEKLFQERLGKATFNELEENVETGKVTPRLPDQSKRKKSKEPGMVAKMMDNLKLYAVIPGGKSSDQAALWAGELYTRLVESEKIDDKLLLSLAEKRAASILSVLEGEDGVAKDRLGTKEPEPLAENSPPSASLSLDAL